MRYLDEASRLVSGMAALAQELLRLDDRKCPPLLSSPRAIERTVVRRVVGAPAAKLLSTVAASQQGGACNMFPKNRSLLLVHKNNPLKASNFNFFCFRNFRRIHLKNVKGMCH